MGSVIDTSTLISLAKVSYLELIPKLRMDVAMPEEVYEEAVINGEKRGIADSTVIKTFINNHELKILNVKSDFIKVLRKKVGKGLTKGDEAVLSLAIMEKAETIITNDDGLGKIAMALGFNVIATPDLLMKGLKNKLLSFKEFEVLMRGLVIENRLSSVVAELYLMEGKKYVEG
jgi:predicted nucleic acid-binding protein